VELPWPRWSGPIELRITATAGNCVATADATAQLAGDVVATTQGGAIWLYGSDGVYLGRIAQVADRRIEGVALIPPDVDGAGIVTIVQEAGDTPPTLVKIGYDGERVDFETETLAREVIYPNNGPRHVAWDPVRQVVVSADTDKVHMWDVDGLYQGALDQPSDRTGFPNSITGFGFFADGTMAVTDLPRRRLYAMPEGGGPQILMEIPDGEAEGIGNAHGGHVVVSVQYGNDVFIHVVGRNGQDVASVELDGHIWAPRYIFAFLDGTYLSTAGNAGSFIYTHGPDLQRLEGRWQSGAPDQSETITGLAWMHVGPIPD
jgi:hypothetical protein